MENPWSPCSQCTPGSVNSNSRCTVTSSLMWENYAYPEDYCPKWGYEYEMEDTQK